MIKTVHNECKNVINILMHLVGLLGRLLEPYMPNTSKHIFKCLNYQYSDNEFKLGVLDNNKMEKPTVLFTKITSDEIESFKQKFG